MSAPPTVPAIVERAFALSRKAGYASFCRNETGRLLAALAATRRGTMAEFGTGCGVGTAWLRSGAPASTRILSAELQPRLAHAAGEIFAGDDTVEVVAADWAALSDRGPFSLVFIDSGDESLRVDQVADLVEAGGVVVIDDFEPCSTWPPMTDGRVDAIREEWLSDDRFVAAEVMVASDATVIVATRR